MHVATGGSRKTNHDVSVVLVIIVRGYNSWHVLLQGTKMRVIVTWHFMRGAVCVGVGSISMGIV